MFLKVWSWDSRKILFKIQIPPTTTALKPIEVESQGPRVCPFAQYPQVTCMQILRIIDPQTH